MTELKKRLKGWLDLMLWTILAILLALWLVGLLADIVGGFIHLLLVLALIVFIIKLVTGRRA